MHLILLSGGSGKRLWPISGDARPKQFLPLFRDGRGGHESMLQRVCRQLAAAAPDAAVTVAAGSAQAAVIREQLGDRVRLCTEPCRRDTFPAIALAAAFLRDEAGVGPDEVVAVCPVDHYVDDSFYEAVLGLEQTVKTGRAELTLMGIEPTAPSEKYGYIVPRTGERISPVAEFREKPDRETAERYIRRGALWNAGVFAFRLRYVLEKARAMISFTDWRDLYDRYETLPRISFDYAVAEKEPSVQVVRYAGSWKDVGSWSTATEAMDDASVGNAVLDETCDNVRVINELDVPVLVMGGKNLVVVATENGILVSEKDRSDAIKPYAEMLDRDSGSGEK